MPSLIGHVRTELESVATHVGHPEPVTPAGTWSPPPAGKLADDSVERQAFVEDLDLGIGHDLGNERLDLTFVHAVRMVHEKHQHSVCHNFVRPENGLCCEHASSSCQNLPAAAAREYRTHL